MLESLTTKPGTFKATCRKRYWTPDLAALMETGADTTQSRWDKKLGCNVFAAQCSLEFTDRQAFEQHMREEHEGGLYRWGNGSLDVPVREVRNYSPRMPIPVKLWSTPKGTAEGMPFKTKAEGIETCKSCGLVAEVGPRAADVLWWDEHVRGCALAAAS